MYYYNENIIYLWHTVIYLSGEALEAGLKRGLQMMGMDPPKERFRSYWFNDKPNTCTFFIWSCTCLCLLCFQYHYYTTQYISFMLTLTIPSAVRIKSIKIFWNTCIMSSNPAKLFFYDFVKKSYHIWCWLSINIKSDKIP